MSEQNPEVAVIESTPMPYKDCSTGLMIFGILTILLGCLAGLMILLMLFGQLVAVRNSGVSASPLSAMLPAFFVYGIVAVALVWLGIGSIQARRWARALLLIFSWSWFVVGVIALIGMAFIVPKILTVSSELSDANVAMPKEVLVVTFMFIFFGIFFVTVPGVWIFFYQSRYVKTTCEMRDPVTRWTDACPLPVLALCLWLALSVLMLLITPVMIHGVVPFFGMFLTGLPGVLLYLALAALWIYAAWRMYQLDVRGWWLILIAMLLFMVSNTLTFARHDMLEMYQLMGYPQMQIDQMQKTGLLTGSYMVWLPILSVLPFLGYILFIKKYFRGKSSETLS